MAITEAKRFLSKSKLSTFLRTQCDRHLYLSLYKNNPSALKTAKLPIPLKTRPAVQLITKSGQEFEQDQFDKLLQAIPKHVVTDSKYSTNDLIKALASPQVPSFILQPAIEPEDFRDKALNNLGLNESEKACIPTMSGLKPDVLYVYQAKAGESEILPDGSRVQITDKETRFAISVIDLKNVVEANASYAAEVCLYAFFFSNWLANEGLDNRYFVSDQIYLWKHTEMPKFQEMLGLRDGSDPLRRIDALHKDLQEGLVDYLIFFPSVKKFFKEDIPRVVTIGDSEGWDKVGYHVSPKCGSCDWLGNKEWLWGEHLDYYNANPDHYCLHSAEVSDHLSKMSGLSKGASKILTAGGHGKIADLVDIPSGTPILGKHALLKKDRSQIGARAKALSTGTLTLDSDVRIGGIASSFNAEYDIIVNFDAGAGLLTGIAIRGILFAPFGETFTHQDGSSSSFKSFHEEAFVNGKDYGDAEWVALNEFITKLATWAAEAQKVFTQKGWGSVSTQICFWEPRQYQELCNAFGRHLIKVLELPEREARALAWLFPADELMERDEQLAPGIVFIRDAVEVGTRLPVKFADTLLGVAEAYHLPTMPPRKIDTYYREPLGNAIPRERVFEIWKSSTNVIKMFGRQISLVEATKRYGDVLKAHAWALGSVTARLRSDFRGLLQGKAPALNLSIPSGASRVAYDAKLWIQWDKVEASTSETEHKVDFITKAERLEASYKAVILPKLIKDLGNYRYEFEVSEESTEGKLEERGKYYVLGLVNSPGFPLQTAARLGVVANPPEIDEYKTWQPLHKIISVTLEKFDRVNRRAVIALRPSWNGMDGVFNALFRQNLIPIGSEPIYILEGLPPHSNITEQIFRAMGNPVCTRIAPEALLSMGATKAKTLKGTDPNKPASRVLWDAEALAKKAIRSDSEARNLSNFAKAANENELNPSQELAVYESVKNQLSVIWGPPGTGKTDTLVALLHSIIIEAQKKTRSRKILITGPNYRAVEELADRLLNNLDSDPNCHAKMFWAYSASREPRHPRKTNTHIDAKAVTLNSMTSNLEAQNLRKSLTNPNEVTILATTAHAINKVVNLVHGRDCEPIQEMFDFVVIDESSQVPVTLAMQALAVLTEEAQLVVAGDHLQMPPIARLDPPKNAEYLVGSIQTYLLKRFPNIKKQELLINYRSNQDLVDFAKTLGYPAELNAHVKDRRLENINNITTVVDSLPDKLPKTAAYKELLDPTRKVTALIHDDVVSSQANEVEAKLVAGLAFCLRHTMAKQLYPQTDGEAVTAFTDDEFFQFGLGVVTPHKAQKALVLKELMILFPEASPQLIFEAVDTVERFQGGERQTIIVSFGVGDLDIIEGEEAFLLQMERTNVAVSRAKAKCIVLMPKALAYYLPTDDKVTKTAKAIKSYIEEFCVNRINIEVEIGADVRLGEVRWH
jgi:hypothetical protein